MASELKKLLGVLGAWHSLKHNLNLAPSLLLQGLSRVLPENVQAGHPISAWCFGLLVQPDIMAFTLAFSALRNSLSNLAVSSDISHSSALDCFLARSEHFHGDSIPWHGF